MSQARQSRKLGLVATVLGTVPPLLAMGHRPARASGRCRSTRTMQEAQFERTFLTLVRRVQSLLHAIRAHRRHRGDATGKYGTGRRAPDVPT
jgi:hypothetical protein